MISIQAADTGGEVWMIFLPCDISKRYTKEDFALPTISKVSIKT